MSLFTHCIHVFLPPPFFTPPTTSKFLHLETRSSGSLRSTCPNHLSLPRLTTFSTPSIPSPSLSSSFGLLSFGTSEELRLGLGIEGVEEVVRRGRLRWFEMDHPRS